MEKTILVVEDETIIALDIKEVLEGEGYDVITVKTVEKAIEIISCITKNQFLLVAYKSINGLQSGLITQGKYNKLV